MNDFAKFFLCARFIKMKMNLLFFRYEKLHRKRKIRVYFLINARLVLYNMEHGRQTNPKSSSSANKYGISSVKTNCDSVLLSNQIKSKQSPYWITISRLTFKEDHIP